VIKGDQYGDNKSGNDMGSIGSHWVLVIAFSTTYLTEDDLITQHVWADYTVTGIILIRLVWGYTGGRYAKFSNFIYQSSAILLYLKSLIAPKPQHYIDHNPAGGAMVIALLLYLSITTQSGMKLY
jgi:cytochrome b